tara:strand:- start:806 stop:1003 length:198 start_codon:yes stop_codon:yes gene_type:complete
MKITRSALKELVRKVYEQEKTAYQQFFEKALTKFGIKSPDDLGDDQKAKFYNYVDSNWQGKTETD